MIKYYEGENSPRNATRMICQWPPCQKPYYTQHPKRSRFCCDDHRIKSDNVDKKTERRELSKAIIEFKENYRILRDLYLESRGKISLPAHRLYDLGFHLKAPCVDDYGSVFYYGPYGVSFHSNETFTVLKGNTDEIKLPLKHGWPNFEDTHGLDT